MNRFAIGILGVVLAGALASPASAQVDPAGYVNFEGAQTAPVRLSPDGTRLFAVNTPDARLSVFDLSAPSQPRLIAEIPVGLEPVSVNPRTNDEAWVVNQASDSISVVSVSRGIVVDTIAVKDEPSDVVFTQDLAFVTVSRSNQVRVFDASSRNLVKTIPVFCLNPRALALNGGGSKVYTTCALSGNRTTVVQSFYTPAQPPPTNPNLPPPPKTGLIIDAENPFWSWLIKYRVADADVAEIDVRSLQVSRYFTGVGTVNLGIAVRPFSGDVYVANTDARNLIRFEPNVRGHWVDNRVTRVQTNGQVSPIDLNPTIDYSVLPNPAAQSIALAQPTAIVFEPFGRFFYVAAFGTDRVAMVDPLGNVLARIDLGPPGPVADSRNMRGPRGLALSAATQRLYVLNRVSNTISVVDIGANAVVFETPIGTFDPTPINVKAGRGFLYDAKLSGSGTGSCASCHLDGDMDMIAWDLGNPGGEMTFVVQNGLTIPMHPMKGPMTTQSLRALSGTGRLHWRGDREDFAAFNPAFNKLMGGSELSAGDMQAFNDFIDSLQYMPNPNQALDRTLPASFRGGDPVAGQNSFMTERFHILGFACASCHVTNPGPGTGGVIQAFPGQDQPVKIPHLRNVYQKLALSRLPGTISAAGVGIEHDGTISSIFDLLSQAAFGPLAKDLARKLNIAAFVECFDTGTAPAVGYTRTASASNLLDPTIQQDWTVLEGQARVGNIDLIVTGTFGGQRHGFLYRPESDDYLADSAGLGPFSRDQLVLRVILGDTLSVMGTPPGAGMRMGIDRDLNGVLNGDETKAASAAGPLGRWTRGVQRMLGRVKEWARAAVV
jgi:DNA-binding beta-propeller fold protein YncE